jgi:threonine/homoserine/homoserine lactone efflux protein
MGQAIGESITFAIGVAISPVPIIAIVLMLLSKKSGANSVAFAFGWVIGVAGVTAVVIAAAGAVGTGSGGTPSHGVSIVKIVLGVLLLVVGLRDWLKRPKAGQQANLPKWLQAIESITPVKSGLLGVALSGLNPKNLLMMVGGGLAIANAPTSTGGKVVAAAVFVLLAISTVVLPVVLFRILGARGQTILESLNAWLQVNNAVVMAVLIVVIGVVLIGKGIAGF